MSWDEACHSWGSMCLILLRSSLLQAISLMLNAYSLFFLHAMVTECQEQPFYEWGCLVQSDHWFQMLHLWPFSKARLPCSPGWSMTFHNPTLDPVLVTGSLYRCNWLYQVIHSLQSLGQYFLKIPLSCWLPFVSPDCNGFSTHFYLSTCFHHWIQTNWGFLLAYRK